MRTLQAFLLSPAHEYIIISILDAGTFSLVDIDTMFEWHCLKKTISATRKLIKWLETKPDTETRREFISRVSTMNMYSAFKSKIGETIVQFDQIRDSWIHKQDHGKINQVHVVDSVYLDFQDVKGRERMLDTSQCVLSKAVDSHIVLAPVHITVDIQHWCPAIVVLAARLFGFTIPRPGTTILMR
ncbi:hypothetical protein GQ600_25475 [Phytophthora cactorum]|nr:hypothetical protein GQ600_25475 [Phytophthora cactorum]